MRLIDADKVLEEWDERTDDHRITDSEFHRMINEDLPIIDLGWHYPSKGEFPPSGEEVLCWYEPDIKVVAQYFASDGIWFCDALISGHRPPVCWQYIEPPKEEA
jgi:hypothetical protein